MAGRSEFQDKSWPHPPSPRLEFRPPDGEFLGCVRGRMRVERDGSGLRSASIRVGEIPENHLLNGQFLRPMIHQMDTHPDLCLETMIRVLYDFVGTGNLGSTAGGRNLAKCE